MPRDPVPAETVSCSWTRDPTKTVWYSVPGVELCPGALLCNAASTDAGITSADTYIINQLVRVPIEITNTICGTLSCIDK